MARADTRSWTNRIDNVLTHRVAGMTVFAVVMACLFEALFSWSEPMITGIETLTSTMQGAATVVLPAGPLRGLVVDGVIAGVGNVVVFVPQIAMLFLFIAVLEDVGYLARVAFVIDLANSLYRRVRRAAGPRSPRPLSGRSASGLQRSDPRLATFDSRLTALDSLKRFS